MNRFASLIAGSWLGMQIMTGYIAAPILFKHLDRPEAGEIAGELFAITGYFGLIAWLFIYLLAQISGTGIKPRCWVLLQIFLIGINQLVAAPVIEAAKHNTQHPLLELSHIMMPHAPEMPHITEFAFWHGFYSLIYMACTVLGLLLLSAFLRIKLRRRHSHDTVPVQNQEDFDFPNGERGAP